MNRWLVQKDTRIPLQPERTRNPFLLGFFTGFLFSTLAFAATVFFVLLFLVPSVFADDGPNEKVGSAGKQRPIGEMRRDVLAFMKNSKNEGDLDLQVGGIIDLCYLHREIATDARFATNRQLQSLRAVAAARLKKYMTTIRIEKARKERRVKKELSELNKQLLAGQNPDDKTTEPPNNEIPLVDSNSNTGQPAEVSEAQLLDEAMFSSLNAMGGVTGGPSQMYRYLSGNFAPPWDHGEELVALIESVISPDSWQRNGGNAIIEYYRPSRIIVVGATSQVQDDLTNMLRNLRRLSR